MKTKLSTFLVFLLILNLSNGYTQSAKYENKYYANSYALVIGINKYPSSKWEELDSAVKGAEAVKLMLQEHNFKVETLYDQQATQKNILAKIEDMIARLSKHDRLLIYFAGHGDKDTQKNGYLVPHDGNDYASYIPLMKLAGYSKDIPAKHVLFILDACYAGFIKTRGGGSRTSNDPKFLENMVQKNSHHAMTAGSKNQEVLDSGGPGGHSPFTGHFIEGIKKGRADGNGDGYITNYELFNYLGPNAATTLYAPSQIRLIGDDDGMFVFTSEMGAVKSFKKIAIGGKKRAKTKKNIENPIYKNEDRQYFEELSAADWLYIGDSTESITEAIRAYTNAIELYPSFTDAYFNRAIAWEDSAEWDSLNYDWLTQQALQDYQKVIEINPFDADAQYNIGSIFLELERYGQALAAFNKALEIDPYDTYSYTGRAFVYLEQKQDAAAFEDYDYAIGLEPEDSYLYYDRGNGFLMIGKNNKAIQDFTQAIALYPDDPEFYRVRAEAYENIEEYDKAENDFDKASQLDSQ